MKECAVVVRDRGSSEGIKTSSGYVVPTVHQLLSVTELRSFLRQKLPDYMLPSAFVMLEALPLTPNGKIDRNALPPPDGSGPQLDQGFVEPRSELEELVAQVWRDVLKLDQIGIYDNFFDLGGHSLLGDARRRALARQLQYRFAAAQIFRTADRSAVVGAY